VIATIEDFMWLKLHMVQPTASSSAATSSRLSPTSSSNLLSPSYTMAALQVTASFADPISGSGGYFPNCSNTLQTPVWDHEMRLFAMHPCASETLHWACHIHAPHETPHTVGVYPSSWQTSCCIQVQKDPNTLLDSGTVCRIPW